MNQPSAPPSPPPPLEGAKLILATIAVALATFMNVLDTFTTGKCCGVLPVNTSYLS
ncbi:MAG TPA: hypothetical protein VMJ11_13400 [Paraburkholderia sp.]|uniref:hypothetical protein n=1 Tax=Paraburkholderia sp. TaxID=1926495 RepID=UPI002C427CFD|nr:hypothetical protein [Paraburkholderia sp.]HTR07616.1 hypothetical protein [Paraburkholderia sp.]